MRMISMALIVIGAIVAVLFVVADLVNLGHDPNAFGSRQITGTVFGLAVFAIGLILRRRAGRAESDAP